MIAMVTANVIGTAGVKAAVMHAVVITMVTTKVIGNVGVRGAVVHIVSRMMMVGCVIVGAHCMVAVVVVRIHAVGGTSQHGLYPWCVPCFGSGAVHVLMVTCVDSAARHTCFVLGW